MTYIFLLLKMKKSLITKHINQAIAGKHQRPIVTDFIYKETKLVKPIVIFCHGYKGFKDWGAWQLMFEAFAKADLFVVAFNFSHNGGTLSQPIDFPDLEAFGNDNFSKQQDDLQSIIDLVTASYFNYASQVDTSQVILIGHSRGGGVSILKAAQDTRITKLVSLASIKSYADSIPKGAILDQWKTSGVQYIKNGRTGQQMPVYYQLYEDFMSNASGLNIERAASQLEIPHLLFHGKSDTAVPFVCAETLHQLSSQSTLVPLDTNHVFGTKHPWNTMEMPKVLNNVTQKIIDFVRN